MNLQILELRDGENSREYAYRLLRKNIMTLTLAPGTVIKENELSNILNMSRTPIHEAVSALKSEWLVEVVPQSGTKVTLIDKALMKEGYNARILLESNMLSEGAGKLSRSEAQQLLSCLDEQEAVCNELAQDPDTFIRLDDEMHRLIYKFCGRSRTWHAIKGLVSHYDRARYIDAMSGHTNTAKLVAAHREFYNILLMGLPSGLDPIQKMRDHLSAFRGEFWDDIKDYQQYFSL